jgi:hypothetical protein
MMAMLWSGVAWADGGALDGKSLVVQSGEQGKAAGVETDRLTFKSGKLRSSACDAYGFGDGAYRAKPDGGGVSFEADTRSAKEGTIHWRGTVRGNAVDGTFVWTKPGQAPVAYWFHTPK